MPRNHLLFVSFFLLFSTACLGQPVNRLQKLEANISSAASPRQKLSATLALCDEWESYSPDTLNKYARLAKQLALFQKNPRAGILADYYLAVYLFQVNKLDTAISLTDDVIRRYRAAFPYDEMYVKLLGLKGNILLRTAKMDELMSLDFDLIKLTEEHKDTLGMARGTLGIGNVNLKLKKYEEALTWYHKALNLMENPLYKRRLSFIYNNMAIIFYYLARQDSALYNVKLFQDSAIYYIKQGVRYSRDDQNLTNLANALFLYGGLLAEFKQLSEAEAMFKEGVEVRKKIGDIYYLINDMGQLGLFYADNKNPQKGIALCKEGLALAEQNGQSYGNINSLYEVLGRNYLAAGDYKNYSDALVKQLALKDSVYKRNSAEVMGEMQTKYDVQKRENVIMQQKFDLSKKNYFIIGSLVLLLVVILASYFIFREYKRRQRIKTRLMLVEEKRKAEQAVTEAEEAERKRIAADLHDSLGAYAASIASNIEHIHWPAADRHNTIALQELRTNSRSIVSQLGDTIWALKKDALPLTAISDRIKIFIQQIQPSYPGITIDVFESIQTDHLLPPSQAFHLFQIVKEAINNALRHSHCRCIAIKIRGDKTWKININDDGEGMINKITLKEGGNGLINMKSRARESGWNIQWQSNEPRGTQVIIEPTTN
jgi:signal transduction histidine kinase